MKLGSKYLLFLVFGCLFVCDTIIATTGVLRMAKAAEPATSRTDQPMRPPRDPAIAVQEEYDAAAKRGTVESLTLFISRHPDSVLAAQARRDIERLQRARR